MKLYPQPMTEGLFKEMEALGIIERIIPKETNLEALSSDKIPRQNQVRTCYANDGSYGGHKLIHVGIFEHQIKNLTSHPENEDFLLIGQNTKTRLVIVAAKYQHELLQRRISEENASSEDFFCFYAEMNDPRLSFFTMKAGFPHGEFCEKPIEDVLEAPTFYVTESRDLPEIKLYLEENFINIICEKE